MNIDCLYNILLYCDINDLLKLLSINKEFNDELDDNNLWKSLMMRDFDDINKLDHEEWIDYYKRRSITYGIPILINNFIYQFNQVKKFISFLDKHHNNLILTKDNDLYIVDNKKFIKVNHPYKIKNIYGYNSFYFVDYNNNLYKLESHTPKLLVYNVNNVIIDIYKSQVYYTNKNGTYYIDGFNNQRFFDFEVLDFISIKGIDYIINKESNFFIGKITNKKYDLKSYDLKAL